MEKPCIPICLTILLTFTCIHVECAPIVVNYPEAGLQAIVYAPEEALPGDNVTYTIELTANRTLKVSVRARFILSGGNTTSWEKIFMGEIGPKEKAYINYTLHVPVSAYTGSILLWVYVEFSSNDDYEKVSGKTYYADWSFIVTGPYVTSLSEKELLDRLERLEADSRRLESEKLGLMGENAQLQEALQNLTRQLDDARMELAEAKEIQASLESRLNYTVMKASKLEEDLKAERNANEELRLYLATLAFALAAVLSIAGMIFAKYYRLTRR